MRRPLPPGAEGDELAADLDHRRIMDLRLAGDLRLRLGGAEGRVQKKQYGEPDKRQDRPAAPSKRTLPFPAWLAKAAPCGPKDASLPDGL